MINRSVRFLTATVILAIAAAVQAAAPDKDPEVTVDRPGKTVSVRSVANGRQVLIFGVSSATTGYDAVLLPHASILTAKNDGSVSFTTENAVPWRSVWYAIDLQTARFNVGSPAGYTPLPVRHARGFRRNERGTNVFAVTGFHVEAAYVHAGGSAWRLTAFDGGTNDADGRKDGVVTLDVSAFTPLEPGSERPKEFTPGGVLFVAELSSMETSAVRITGATLNGAQ